MSRRTKRHAWFRRLSGRIQPFVRAVARKQAKGDADLMDDLMQEARIAMYMVDPERYVRARNPEGLACKTAWRAMRRYRRWSSTYQRGDGEFVDGTGYGVLQVRRRRGP